MTRTEIMELRRRADELAAMPNPRADAVLSVVADIKRSGEFGIAVGLLDRVRPRLANDPQHKALAQAHALCTYKDANLQADKRYRKALAILREIGLDSGKCEDAETLGQGGAIYKRMWESSGQLEYLHTALAFYRAGWERDTQHDRGWGGVNAAYILDILAFRERTNARRTGTTIEPAERLEVQARELRHDLRHKLPAILAPGGEPADYWDLATLAEIDFGLRDYAAAGKWLAKARDTDHDNWMLQSTARQLTGLARLQRVRLPEPGEPDEQWEPAWQALYRLLGEDAAAAIEDWRGKVGLALSGGGFRAALFHLGVLARLAECDVLRSVETLSTVSGGSILGAQYYLELRHLLQEKADTAITRADYVALVGRLIEATVAGVRENLRVRALLNPWANLKMVFLSSYSRSMRMGELYETLLFDKVDDGEREEGKPRRLRCLRIHPATTRSAAASGPTFRPRAGNWLRHAKVPNLMLNTTSLNSGHNWHFTASWMGEPPGLTGDEIDTNDRYRRLYYEQAPNDALRDYSLAYAVAASACVPALFEPLPLKDLYPGRIVRLVDGGVHDNQGMAGLLDDDCNFILCSDASGQMESQPKPANGMLGVFWRSDSILQDRVRQAQYRDIEGRSEAGALQGLFFIHLKQELEPAPIDWIDCDNPHFPQPASTCTRYGVDREIQRLLSEIRTDLDSFTEVECYSLMASGYLMATHQLHVLERNHQAAGLHGKWGGFETDAPMWKDSQGADYWPFAPLIPILRLPSDSSDLRRRDLAVQLKAGSIMFFRVWHLVGWLRHTAYAAGTTALLAGVCWVWQHWNESISRTYSIQVGATALAGILVVAGLLFPMLKYLDIRRTSQSAALGIGAALFGCAASGIHLLIFEPLLRGRGKLERLLKLKP